MNLALARLNRELETSSCDTERVDSETRNWGKISGRNDWRCSRARI